MYRNEKKANHFSLTFYLPEAQQLCSKMVVYLLETWDSSLNGYKTQYKFYFEKHTILVGEVLI